MCLAVPMEVTAVDGTLAEVIDNGVLIRVDCSLTPDLAVGDKVLIHAGFVIEKLEPDEAAAIEATWAEYLASFDAGKK